MSAINKMWVKSRLSESVKLCSLLLLVTGFCVLTTGLPAQALGSQQNPQGGSVGLEGKVGAPPPANAATISTPGNGQTVTHIPITVAGLCTSGLLIKVFSNNIFVGSAQCNNGSYSLAVDLFSGRNDLVVRQYDALDQSSPDSNMVSVTFTDAQFLQFGTRVSLSSSFAELGANPGDELSWPITISGGIGPYALSVDWGDGTAPALQSVSFAGPLNITHVYKSAGIYKVIVQATDKNGTTAFLQLVGVGTGKVGQNASSTGNSSTTPSTATTTTKISIWMYVPFILLFPLIFMAFWLGRRHELFELRKKLEKATTDAKLT